MSGLGFRAGDVVRHSPTGEKWRLALDQIEDRVYWCGYPFGGYGQAHHCELLVRADDERRASTLRDVIASKDAQMAAKARSQLESQGRA